MFFDLPPGDFIPSIPWGDARPRPDPNRRPAQALVPPNVAEWAASRPRWTMSTSSGELESRSYMLAVDPDEINSAMTEARKRYGNDAVKVVILHLAPEALEGRFHELRFYGYERCEARESKEIPELCFITHKPKLWR